MGKCKFLLHTHAKISFLESQLRSALTFPFDKIVVVSSPAHFEDINKIISLINSDRIEVVINDNEKSERFHSLQCGFRALTEIDQYFIQNSDCPELNRETIKLLLNSLDRGDAIIPSYQRKGGHPVLINKKIATHIVSVDSSSRLDVELKKFRLHYVDVNDSSIHIDIDTIQDYEKYLLAKVG